MANYLVTGGAEFTGSHLCRKLESLSNKVVDQKGVFNAGSVTTIKVNRIAHLIKEYSKSKIIHIKPRPGEVQRLCCDTGKIKKLGWRPKTSIEEGIRKYVDFYKNSFL